MTRKDYVKAAQIVCDMYHFGNLYEDLTGKTHTRADGATDAFCLLFRSDNPNFDETRFREACKKG